MLSGYSIQRYLQYLQYLQYVLIIVFGHFLLCRKAALSSDLLCRSQVEPHKRHAQRHAQRSAATNVEKDLQATRRRPVHRQPSTTLRLRLSRPRLSLRISAAVGLALLRLRQVAKHSTNSTNAVLFLVHLAPCLADLSYLYLSLCSELARGRNRLDRLDQRLAPPTDLDLIRLSDTISLLYDRILSRPSRPRRRIRLCHSHRSQSLPIRQS